MAASRPAHRRPSGAGVVRAGRAGLAPGRDQALGQPPAGCALGPRPRRPRPPHVVPHDPAPPALGMGPGARAGRGGRATRSSRGHRQPAPPHLPARAGGFAPGDRVGPPFHDPSGDRPVRRSALGADPAAVSSLASALREVRRLALRPAAAAGRPPPRGDLLRSSGEDVAVHRGRHRGRPSPVPGGRIRSVVRPSWSRRRIGCKIVAAFARGCTSWSPSWPSPSGRR